MTSSTPRDDTNAELRERARSHAAEQRAMAQIPGQHRCAVNADIIDDLLSALDAAEGRVREATLHVWRGWHEMNTIRARDGIPYTYSGRPSDVDETYWSDVVDDMSDFLGDDAKPWPPKFSLSAQHPKAGAQEAEGESGGGVCWEAELINSNTEMMEAGCTGPSRDRVIDEIMHYLMVYSQDGPYTARIRTITDEGFGEWETLGDTDDTTE